MDWEPAAEEQDHTGSSSGSEDQRKPIQVVHKRQAISVPKNDKRRVQAQPAGANLPIRDAAPVSPVRFQPAALGTTVENFPEVYPAR
jgi:hypothetical protein